MFPVILSITFLIVFLKIPLRFSRDTFDFSKVKREKKMLSSLRFVGGMTEFCYSPQILWLSQFDRPISIEAIPAPLINPAKEEKVKKVFK